MQGGEKYPLRTESHKSFDIIKRQPMVSAAVFFAFGQDDAARKGVVPRFAAGPDHGTDELFRARLINWCHAREVDQVPVYLDVLVVLNFLVDLLLLVGTNRLAGFGAGVKRAVAAAALGGVYGGVCVLPGWTFLAGTHWRVIVLALMAGVSFGFCRDAVRRGILFILLSMALGGVAVGLESGGFCALVAAALTVSFLCVFGFRGRVGARYVPVKVGSTSFTALVDTGNTLTDPLTGQQILVVSAHIGEKLLNVKAPELSDPVQLMERLPGVRLIPFSAVGRSSGVLPVKRFEDVHIGAWRGSCLVAFAPNELGRGKPYEALTGGVL